MSKTWTIDAEGVLTIRAGFRKRKGKPDFFERREEIKAIVVDVGVSEIGDGWFNYLNEVREISLPTTLRRIGKSAFASCERLEEVFIPEGVEELAESAFQDCSHVRRFHLPATLRSIGFLALHVGDGHLLSIDVAKQNGHFASSHGVLYNHDKTTILQYPCGKRRKEYTIPASVTEINNSAFYECEQLRKVVLPQSLQSIWEKAFRYCRSLIEIEIPPQVWHITDDVFEGCTSLRRIILHSKVIDSLSWVPEGAELIKQLE